nr:ribosome biogenesis GTPase Der [Bacteroidales bacterium]
MSTIIAIVGRPNVGKSTLFNRLTGSRTAIEDTVSGVTRDRNYGQCEWNGKNFSVIDTGGYIENSEDVFAEEINKQIIFAVEQADLIVFLVDAHEGITPMDTDIANILRKVNKKTILTANKADNTKYLNEASEFYNFGFDNLYFISAISGSGTGELLDYIAANIQATPETEYSDLPKIAIVGKPNTGKSSLLNALTGEQRSIVTDIPGTTRDSVFTPYNKFKFNFLLIDTAGIRKKNKVYDNIEFYSILRSVRAIEESDVCLLLIDATEGTLAQDMYILNLIQKNKKGLVIVINKWDLVEKDTKTSKTFEQSIRNKIAPFSDVPIIFTSVINNQRIFKTLEAAMEVFENLKRKIPTSKLNKDFAQILEQTPPPSYKSKRIKIKYLTQLPTKTPSFVLFCSNAQYV